MRTSPYPSERDPVGGFPLTLALVCVESSCSWVACSREYPSHRCPQCGSEMVSLAVEEQRRVEAAA